MYSPNLRELAEEIEIHDHDVRVVFTNVDGYRREGVLTRVHVDGTLAVLVDGMWDYDVLPDKVEDAWVA